jgi:hypothetical protein
MFCADLTEVRSNPVSTGAGCVPWHPHFYKASTVVTPAYVKASPEATQMPDLNGNDGWGVACNNCALCSCHLFSLCVCLLPSPPKIIFSYPFPEWL